ncbi:MAG: hypothetical protein M1835_002673 [Candelina submexicana]|nr:MAG: hypothetical protein M1835_002673 [Candelina submexicana]
MQVVAVLEGMLVLNKFRKWCSNLSCLKSSHSRVDDDDDDDGTNPAMVQVRSSEIEEKERISILSKKSTKADHGNPITTPSSPSTFHVANSSSMSSQTTFSSMSQSSHALKSSKSLIKRATTRFAPHSTSQRNVAPPCTRSENRSSRLKSHEQENPFHDRFSIPDAVNMGAGIVSAGGAVVSSVAAVKTMNYMRGGSQRATERDPDLEMGLGSPARQVPSTISTAPTVAEAGDSPGTLRGTDGGGADGGSKVERDGREG